jgi:HNH endonuclease
MAHVLIVYRGHRYRRYPDSPHRQHRCYFHATGPRRGFLHRHIWEDYYECKVPPKHDIHHIDGDTLNNAIDNLECIPKSRHMAMHLAERSSTPEHLAHLAAIRPMAAAWHASDAGTEWHSVNGRKSWSKRVKTIIVCRCCSKEVLTFFPDRTQFCNQNCRARYRRRGPD